MKTILLTEEHRRQLVRALHVFVLSSFALAQPVYDLLGRNADFFVAHRSGRLDLIVFVFTLSLVLPSFIVLSELALTALSSKIGEAVHFFAVLLLTALTLLPILGRFESLPGVAIVLLAAVIGVAITICYFRLSVLRLFLTILTPSLLAFPLIFLFGTPVIKVLIPGPESLPGRYAAASDTPIVMVVFDEFSSIYLMNEDGQIDRDRFPNFASLADGAYWFRNATTVVDNTVYGVPAILTGRYPPDESRVATVGDYPENLFTLFGGTHDLNVVESVTTLCPETLCVVTEDTLLGGRLKGLIEDSAVVYLAATLPDDWTAWLPPVSEGWENFAFDPMQFGEGTNWFDQVQAVIDGDRATTFRHFVDSLSQTGRRTLDFMHILLPHEPLIYLPSGRLYPPSPARGKVSSGDSWTDDAWAVTLAEQRYFLQLQFVDRLLGELIDRLKDSGRYDESLLVVTADHGVSFRPNDSRRPLTDTNLPDIAAVPLFIKTPGQTSGQVSDMDIQTIDILPTILDVAGVTMPWSVDGVSAFNERERIRGEKVIYHSETGVQDRHTFSSEFAGKFSALSTYSARFGPSADAYGLFQLGPYADIVGTSPQMYELVESDYKLRLDQLPQLSNASLDSGWLPAFLTGEIESPSVTVGVLDLAIELNGTVAAVTRSFDAGDAKAQFEVMVPERDFVDGANSLRVYAVDVTEGEVLRLLRIQSGSLERFEISQEDPYALTSSSGQTFLIQTGPIQGRTERIIIRPPILTLTGWAVDTTNMQPPDEIVVFAGTEYLYSGKPTVLRPGVAEFLGQTTVGRSGFEITLPLALLSERDDDLRVYAVSEGAGATELRYPDDSRNTLLEARDVNASFTLDESSGATRLRQGAVTVPLQKGRLRENVDRAEAEADQLIVSGWAVDGQGADVPLSLAIFANDTLVHLAWPWVPRADVAERFGGNARLFHSGFNFSLPVEDLGNLEDLDLRMFAIFSDGSAEELLYPPEYPYHR